MSTTMRAAVYTLAAWAAAILCHFLLIVGAAVALEEAPLAAAERASVILLQVHLLIAIIATVFIFFKTRAFTRLKRTLWVGGFAVLQLGTWASAAITLLVVLNR
ncbi:MAG: hypothetical protein IPM53_07280 [Anaerolineaceae bacterium]|nr:hypothetical protein [Anaerolineaceae bacterium]